MTKRRYQCGMKLASLRTFDELWKAGQVWFWLEHATHSQTIHGSVLRNMSVGTVQRWIDRGKLFVANEKEGRDDGTRTD